MSEAGFSAETSSAGGGSTVGESLIDAWTTAPADAEPLRWANVRHAARGAQIALLSLIAADFALSLGAVGVRTVALGGGSGQDNDGGLGLTTLYMQIVLAGADALLSLVAFFLALPALGPRSSERLSAVALLKVACVLLTLGYLAYPQAATVAVGVAAVLLRLAELSLIAWITRQIARHTSHAEPQRPPPTEAALDPLDIGRARAFLCALDEFADLRSVRVMLRRKFKNGRAVFCMLCVLVLGVLLVNALAQFMSMITTQATILPESAIERLQLVGENASSTPPPFVVNETARNKVLVIVLDGLRYDYLSINPTMAAFLNDSNIRKDMALLHVRSQLPSMSVPNWITIVTGARPESTGVLGNLLVPETTFDSIFREAKLYNMNRGLTGSPWFGQIVKMQLPWFKGDGTIPTGIDEEHVDSADLSDHNRWLVARQALQTKDDPYQLFLVHLSDIDVQGHGHGVSPKWNKEDTYNGAVTNKTEIVSDLLGLVDNNTVVFILSDHGQVSRGGHGGIDEVLLDAPLMIWKRDSGLASKSFSHPSFRAPNTPKQNVDVAPTVCAMLGVPVPRTSEGVFIDEALNFVPEDLLGAYYQDLFAQKRAFLLEFLSAVGERADVPDDPFANEQVPPGTNDTVLQQYVDLISSIDSIYSAKRDKTIRLQQARNYGTSALFALGYVVCSLVVLSKLLFCTPSALWRSNDVGFPIGFLHMNRMAFFGSFVCVAVSIAASVLIYIICYSAIGYKTWDSTVIHTPEVVPTFFVITLLPATIVAILTTVIGHYSSPHDIAELRWLPQSVRKTFASRTLGARAGDKEASPARRHLWRCYTLFWTIILCGAVLVAQGSFSFTVPGLFDVRFVTTATWATRFRVFTIELFVLPLFVTALVTLFLPYSWKRRVDADVLDSVLLLMVCKERSAKKPSSKPQNAASSSSSTAKSSGEQQPAEDNDTLYDIISSSLGKPISRLHSVRKLPKVLRPPTSELF